MGCPRLFFPVFLAIATSAVRAQMPPTEYATFTSHGKGVSCPIYENRGATGTLILLRGADLTDIAFGRLEARFFAEHGFRVLLPEYLSVTASTKLTPANYRRWAEVVDDIVAEERARPDSKDKKIAVAGQFVGGSVALIAGSHQQGIGAIAEWSGLLPNQFFSQVQSMPPLLILHGELDEETPIVNARQLVRLCELKDFTCETQIYAGQGHLFSAHIMENANQRALVFFRTYLSK